MSDIHENLAAILRRAAERLRGAGLPNGLAEQVHEPCVVAVVGRVKVGKSTFVNALLGEDLAKVGTTETTATIRRSGCNRRCWPAATSYPRGSPPN